VQTTPPSIVYFAVCATPTQGAHAAFVLVPFSVALASEMEGAVKTINASYPYSGVVDLDNSNSHLVFDNRLNPEAARTPSDVHFWIGSRDHIVIRTFPSHDESPYLTYWLPTLDQMQYAAIQAARNAPDSAHLIVLCDNPHECEDVFGRNARHVLAGALLTQGDLMALGEHTAAARDRNIACFESMQTLSLDALLQAAPISAPTAGTSMGSAPA